MRNRTSHNACPPGGRESNVGQGAAGDVKKIFFFCRYHFSSAGERNKLPTTKCSFATKEMIEWGQIKYIELEMSDTFLARKHK